MDAGGGLPLSLPVYDVCCSLVSFIVRLLAGPPGCNNDQCFRSVLYVYTLFGFAFLCPSTVFAPLGQKWEMNKTKA